MRRKYSDNSFGAVAHRLRRIHATSAGVARLTNGKRQSERWFMRVYNLFMNNGWALRHKSNEYLGY